MLSVHEIVVVAGDRLVLFQVLGCLREPYSSGCATVIGC